MFRINEQYSKNDIYRILDVPKQSRRGAWDTGYRKYKDDIYLFANIGVAGRTGENHNNHWDRGDMIWFSKGSATSAQPVIREMLNPGVKVHIFTRNDSRDPFTYQGLGRAINHSGERPVRVRWKLRTESTIDSDSAWNQFRISVESALRSGETYGSDVLQAQYRVDSVNPDQIVVRKQDDSSDARAILTRKEFLEAIEKINLTSGTIPRGSLLRSDELETTMVWFLSMLDLDDDREGIEVIPTVEEPQNYILKEASNDEERSVIIRALRTRRGQNKLRDNLLYLYNRKCCITGTSVEETLHACHLFPHAESGINHSTNALLMRSDIHDLFDECLLGIDPESLRVKIKAALSGTMYSGYDGTQLLTRRDGLKPDVAALKRRWEMFLNFQKRS